MTPTKKQHRYGELLLTIEGVGRFYWARPLQLVTFVAKGARTAHYSWPLDWKRNTRRGALNKALKVGVDYTHEVEL